MGIPGGDHHLSRLAYWQAPQDGAGLEFNFFTHPEVRVQRASKDGGTSVQNVVLRGGADGLPLDEHREIGIVPQNPTPKRQKPASYAGFLKDLYANRAQIPNVYCRFRRHRPVQSSSSSNSFTPF